MRQWQEMFYQRRYSSTCLRYRKSCPVPCTGPGENCPEYTPDFIRLAESYGARGIRVTTPEDIEPALLEARNRKNGPTVIEFMIEREENVMPIVPAGNSLGDMILGEEDNVYGKKMDQPAGRE